MYQSERPRELITIEHYINLSAEINYHLSASKPNLHALLALVLGPSKFEDQYPLLATLDILQLGYGTRRRKIGPLAVIHPLRTASLLSRCMPEPTILDLLGCLLHDKGEDLTDNQIPKVSRMQFNEKYRNLLDNIGKDNEWFIQERIDLLTIQKGQPYSDYLMRLMGSAEVMPDLLHVKLADRLDNTLDNHVQRPGVTRYNFYRSVFDLLFVSVFEGVKIREYHYLPSPKEGSLLLSQLFKNIVFLSLLRNEGLDKLDETTKRLFDAISIASIREAQWIALELFAAHTGKEQIKDLRRLVLDTMEYSYSGGAVEIHDGSTMGNLSGMILQNYAIKDGRIRKKKMMELYNNREHLTQAIVLFIASFASFLNNSEFSIKGISKDGITAVTPKSKRK